MIPHFHQGTVIVFVARQLVHPQASQCHPLHIIIEVIPEVLATITAMLIPVVKSRKERFHYVLIQIGLISRIVCMTDISVDDYIQRMSLRPSAAAPCTCRFSGFRCIRFFPINASAESIPSASILKEIFDVSFCTCIGSIRPVYIRHIFAG
ncbi:hypothetical protein IMSAGC022_00046 [Alistipes sp.]|nr:hypothetical protein IMSAGC022_00046 [Alistipes sp.]